MRANWVAAIVIGLSATAQAQDRHVGKLRLPSNQTVVVAEGDLEARSTGSFSVRLYAAADARATARSRGPSSPTSTATGARTSS